MRSAEESPSPELTSRLIDRTPGFYGWVVLGAALLVSALTIPGQTVGVSVFLDSIIDDLGLNRSTVSGLYTVGTALGAISLTYVGRFLDRYGPRLGGSLIAGLFAGACVFLGTVQTVFMLAVGFVLIRGLGQGALGLASVYAINLWFVRRRGLAIGIAGVGFALAISIFPATFESLQKSYGWRTSYFVLGGAVAALAIPLTLLFRKQPERYGLSPDGPLATAVDGGTTVELRSITPDVARRSGVFWLFALGVFTVSGLSTGVVFHHFSILASAELTRAEAATVFLPYGLSTAAFGLLGGVLVDRYPHRWTLAGGELCLAAALLSAVHLTTGATVALYGVALGATQGLITAVAATVYAHEFGRGFLGEIKGTATSVNIAGSATGPLLYGVAHDAFGSYGPTLAWSALLPIGIAAVAMLRPPASMRAVD